MNSVYGVALIGAITLIVSTLWQFGGRRAWQRRVVREELDLISSMPADSPSALELGALVEKRMRRYVGAEPGDGSGRTSSWLDVAITVVAFAVALYLFVWQGDQPEDKPTPVWASVIAVTALLVYIAKLRDAVDRVGRAWLDWAERDL